MNKEMEYYEKRFPEPVVLAEGEYEGFKYIVLNLGTHPCAYVNVGHTWLKGLNYWDVEKLENNIVHGDFTYSSERVRGTDITGWWLGWDYSHYGDQYGKGDFGLYGRKYTTAEIEFECRNAIDQLKKIAAAARKEFAQ